MGRSRGPKFSFPIPGRKSHTKVDKHTPAPDIAIPIPPIPSSAEWSPRLEEAPSLSKAQRLLGNVPLPRPSSRSRSSIPQSPGYMTITVSEASFGSEYDDKASSTVVEDPLLYPKRPGMVSRSSSNLLGQAYRDDGRRGSNGSSISRRLHPQTSNSTMRSFYDPQKSPLSVSQQTSDSAVRDMALRKGMPPVAHGQFIDDHVSMSSSFPTSDDSRHAKRKSKPARLDLSKLFPKPKANGGYEHARTLLSPNKLVNSPSAMSAASEYFPRPMTREPTPTPNTRGHAKLTKTAKRQQASPLQPSQSSSPVRLHKRDTYDNAKINVRRPPRGIQHWFEGLDEVSDEDYEDEATPLYAPVAVKALGPKLAPVRKSSLGRVLQDSLDNSRRPHQPHYAGSTTRQDHLTHASSPLAHRLNSPSQFSVQSQSSTKTRESAISRTNLQNSSVLSISSSESESEEESATPKKVSVRASLDLGDDHGDIIIGKAQAFEMRPRLGSRAPSASKLSMMSTSTNAATIEVMYTPEPYNPDLHFPRTFGGRRSSQDRRSSHLRQPSTIHEDDSIRPKTSENRSMSPASTSNQSARSEPRQRTDGHKLMAVTQEEEALLEMMRRKRAAMAKHSFTEGYKTAMLAEEVRQRTPPELVSPRTSAFLTMETPFASPRVSTTNSRKAVTSSVAPALLPVPTRGRARGSVQDVGTGTSVLHDSSLCDSHNIPDARFLCDISPHTPPHHLAPPSELSPLDPFPSPAPTPTTISVASPTTTEHASPLPSPVTPGLRSSVADINVKVASSEPSCDGEDEVPVLETGVIDLPSGSIKPEDSHTSTIGIHQRRRTASSGADVAFTTPGLHAKHSHSQSHATIPLKSKSSIPNPSASFDELPLAPVRESTLTVSTGRGLKSSHSQTSMSSTRTSSPAASALDRRSSRITSGSSVVSRGSSVTSMKRESVVVGSASTRCSVSEDVLAAWGSLGGLRDYDYGRV
ncbi:hypothetical protein BDV96DRAFT_491583 [Lophiotrema nucula]|uniref:Uncharacterized protein n=1 Tax=Lophiotrema nucula TaxID=690887 RepID=A0A6A5Z950_9PLEO|nr:hypothetical protein BDV96DRAFT_491583 [Lophiotrema nucula]